MGSSSATVPNPMSEATAFFIRLDQPEVNDLDPTDFWGFGPPMLISMALEFLGIMSLT